jgi:hypothetical protein
VFKLTFDCKSSPVGLVRRHGAPYRAVRRGKALDENLERLIRELGEAINDAINESEEIHEAMERIRATGAEVMLILEATIAFKEKPVTEEAAEEGEKPKYRDISIEQRLAEVSHEDRQFLRSLNIKFDNDE